MSGRLPKRRAEDQPSIVAAFKKPTPQVSSTVADVTASVSEEQSLDALVGSAAEGDDLDRESIEGVSESSPPERVEPQIVAATASGTAGGAAVVGASSSAKSYNELVVEALASNPCSNSEKWAIIRGRRPPANAELPFTEVRDSRKQSGLTKRYLSRNYFDSFDWLGYHDGDGDLSKAGVFCVACSLFPGQHREGSQRALSLVSKLHTNFKKLREDAQAHDKVQYHRDSAAKLLAFLSTTDKPSTRVDSILSETTRKQVENNRAVILSIVRCLDMAARHGISLRGHRDNLTAESPEGNFHGLIRFAIASGDTVLKAHLESCGKNASYVSNNSQNEILQCMAEELVAHIVTNVKKSHYYGIQADEVSDVSGWEQLGLSIRYVKDGEAIEQHVAFLECSTTTGNAICQKIVAELKRLGLDVRNCHAQAYDGAGAMSGNLNGCQAKFREHAPEAAYYHCSSHQLNLALSKACSVQQIHCMMASFTSLGIFFKYSPKRQRWLEACTACLNEDRKAEGKPEIPQLKLKLLSTTRWVERHTAISDFCSLYEAVVFCLQVLSKAVPAPSVGDQKDAGISEPMEIGNLDTKTVTEANGLLHSLSSDSFLVALNCSLFASGYLKPLSVMLQGSHLDVLEAYDSISSTVDLLKASREQSTEKFHPIFQAASAMSQLHGRPSPGIPRQAGRQTQRSNVPAENPEEYWCRSVFIPFLDALTAELDGRFSSLTKKAVQALLLMPSNLAKLSGAVVQELGEAFKADLPEPLLLAAEVDRWRKKWERVPADQLPVSLNVLLNDHVNPLMYPNISRMLHLILVVPVTSANVERANSSLKFIKTDLRSRMSQDRLNALVLLYIHRAIPVDPHAVVDRFARAHPRRMTLINPLR